MGKKRKKTNGPGGIPTRKEIAALKRAGGGRDTILAHITPAEARMLMRHGGGGRINPRTGLPKFESDWGNDLGPYGALGSEYNPNTGEYLGSSTDRDLYLQRYQDVANAGVDPWQHYNQYGKSEGRVWGPDPAQQTQPAAQAPDPSLYNSNSNSGYTGTPQERDYYYELYPDVAQAGVDPWLHYQTHGQNEGRTWGIPTPKVNANDPVPQQQTNVPTYYDVNTGLNAPVYAPPPDPVMPQEYVQFLSNPNTTSGMYASSGKTLPDTWKITDPNQALEIMKARGLRMADIDKVPENMREQYKTWIVNWVNDLGQLAYTNPQNLTQMIDPGGFSGGGDSGLGDTTARPDQWTQYYRDLPGFGTGAIPGQPDILSITTHPTVPDHLLVKYWDGSTQTVMNQDLSHESKFANRVAVPVLRTGLNALFSTVPGIGPGLVALENAAWNKSQGGSDKDALKAGVIGGVASYVGGAIPGDWSTAAQVGSQAAVSGVANYAQTGDWRQALVAGITSGAIKYVNNRWINSNTGQDVTNQVYELEGPGYFNNNTNFEGQDSWTANHPSELKANQVQSGYDPTLMPAATPNNSFGYGTNFPGQDIWTANHPSELRTNQLGYDATLVPSGGVVVDPLEGMPFWTSFAKNDPFYLDDTSFNKMLTGDINNYGITDPMAAISTGQSSYDPTYNYLSPVNNDTIPFNDAWANPSSPYDYGIGMPGDNWNNAQYSYFPASGSYDPTFDLEQWDGIPYRGKYSLNPADQNFNPYLAYLANGGDPSFLTPNAPYQRPWTDYMYDPSAYGPNPNAITPGPTQLGQIYTGADINWDQYSGGPVGFDASNQHLNIPDESWINWDQHNGGTVGMNNDPTGGITLNDIIPPVAGAIPGIIGGGGGGGGITQLPPGGAIAALGGRGGIPYEYTIQNASATGMPAEYISTGALGDLQAMSAISNATNQMANANPNEVNLDEYEFIIDPTTGKMILQKKATV